MPTLKTVSQQIADSLNRPFDLMLIERLKDLIIQESATLLQQTMDKDGVDKEYRQTYIVPLKIVNADELPINIENKKILRSVNRIPTPVRYKNNTPFMYVGTRDGSYAFGMGNYYSMNYHHTLPYVGESITYDYIDKYLYIFNNIKLESARVDAVYPFSIMNTFREQHTYETGVCFVDEMELPLPMDLINTLQAKLKQYILNPIDMQDKVIATHLDNN